MVLGQVCCGVVQISGVMIPSFPGNGIILESLPRETELESHGIDSNVELVPHIEPVPGLESDPNVESAPLMKHV